METCKIQWIDKNNNPTPDNNIAIGYTQCKCLYHKDGHEPIPICKDHWSGNYHRSFYGANANWILLPTKQVVDSIRDHFPNDLEKILTNIHFSSLENCWHFRHGQLYVGVELDGTLHT